MNIPRTRHSKGTRVCRCGGRDRHSRGKLSLHLREVTGNKETADFHIMLFGDVGTNTTRVKELSPGNRKDRGRAALSPVLENSAHIYLTDYIKKKACH